ncbi:unnamed protein product [Tuber melanosporum]|uniref:(Perigord truffle) hypothetical protein n=1 Tax=Tuber melanosporum (strain Mel28) TaxID=656061 RepID=D5GH74_TUBMM|nr:uncharacterized protein GSTUM_00007779001 [Tuber melanosporum]CAZ83899.1 unnamed protein product [Tuber melanosporum]
MPIQYQATGQPGGLQGYPSQQGIPPVPPLPTGLSSFSPQSQQTFSSLPQQQPQQQQQQHKKAKSQTKIPTIRLSFITAADQAKFEQLFKAAVGEGQALSGDKARDILLRSQLSPSDLHQIWQLADTTKSGQLLFPEFALAMYLCNLKRGGKTLPSTLPEVVRNEVSSMVDIISFGVPDSAPLPAPRTNVPSFEVSSAPPQTPQTAISPSQPTGQPQPSNSQLLGMMAQPTGFQPQQTGIPGLQSQRTGFPTMQTQFTGFQPQQTGITSQATGYGQGPGSYGGSIPPVPPIPTGVSSLMPSGMNPLQAQPTGRPGQWGFVNTPASVLQGIDALQERMMPQPGREGGFSTQGLQGNAVIPWSITKVEKQKYDQVFEGWDGLKRGLISGDTAIEVFGQSGLPKDNLMQIWTLADSGNKGSLNKDEFAVAMHLIFRKLNGYEIPTRLPPELIPPSTKKFSESLSTVKSFLQEGRKASALQPQATGVSYLKSRSFHDTATAQERKDGTVYRFDDNQVGYKSSARHRAKGARSPSPAVGGSPSPSPGPEMTLDQLRKRVREKQILLNAIDIKDEDEAENDDILDRRDRRDADDLYRRIRRVQEDIDANPNAAVGGTDLEAERRQLRRQLQNLADRLPDLASKVRKTERGIADAKLSLFGLRDAKAHPGSASVIIGTGPGGAITESDRIKARSKAMMQQRLAALTGKPAASTGDDDEAASRRLAEETQKIKSEQESNDRMTRDVEDSVTEFRKSLEGSLKFAPGESGGISDSERRRWEEALGVEDEVKEFIFDLQRQSHSAKLRREDDRDYRRPLAPPSRTSTPSGSSYSSFKSAEERAAFIKQQAEQKMAERLAALGIKPPARSNIGETAQQRAERERKEREERLRKAEEEEAMRERNLQQRLADEQPKPPAPITSKKPPPPAPRRAKDDNQAKARAEEQARKAEESLRAAEEQALKEEQAAQRAKIEQKEEESRAEEEALLREQEAARARLQALEDKVKQGKLQKQEEKKKRQAALQATKEKEARLAAMRAEIERAREEEERLKRLQMELEDSSSDEEGPEELGGVTPTKESVSEEQFVPAPSPSSTAASPPPPPPPPPPPAPPLPPAVKAPSPPATAVPSVPPTSVGADTNNPSNNPFLKHLGANGDVPALSPAAPASTASAAPSAPSAPSSSGAVPSKNPFYKLNPDQTAEPSPRTFSRRQPEEDDWSVVDGGESSSDDDDDPPNRQGTRALAEMLFSTMAPPRPLSSMGSKETEQPISPSIGGAPPPPPPPPPPPAPPMPSGSSAPVAPPIKVDVGSLLNEISLGRALRKTETKDRSAPASGGRVVG